MSSSTCSPRVLLRHRKKESRGSVANAKKSLERPPNNLLAEVRKAADSDSAEADAVIAAAMVVVVALEAVAASVQARASCRWSAASWRRWVARKPACR